jgi:hypothetical protein
VLTTSSNVFSPRFSSQMASYDVASTVHQSRINGSIRFELDRPENKAGPDCLLIVYLCTLAAP